ncbi:hypothetical protein C2E23DRAFT_833102 [Lenzites betulinus]|nr:hypothetical protein C2E23DRAFT_833102 [Lenzites betulinus]
MPEILPNPDLLRSQVIAKLGEVSQEYYEWEHTHCARILGSLSVTTQPSSYGPESWMTLNDSESEDDGNTPPELGARFDTVEFTVYERRGQHWDCSTKPVHTALHVDPPSPTSAYESCAPICQNILHGDDPNYMPFIPHADDSNFSHEDHALEYKALAWQQAYRESDTLAVVTETARRLYFEHGIPPSQIDDTEVLPLMLQTTTTWGAVWTGNHSDQIVWPGSTRTVPVVLPDVSPPHIDNLQGHLQEYLALWCPQLDCLQGHCFTHNVEQIKVKKDMTHTAFRCLSVALSCGKNCISENDFVLEDDVGWTDQEIEDLRTIAFLGAPMTPCSLATLCRKPCYEVALVCRKHDDFRFIKRLRGRPRTEVAKKHTKPIFGPEEAPEFVPNQPCNHSGPCLSTCPCHRNKAHCMRNCRCVLTCPRRLRGCKCPSNAPKPHKVRSSTRGACNGKRCPCRASKRECDPELCVPCGRSASAGEYDVCQKMQILAGRHVMTEVKIGRFGMGLVLVEDVEEGALITEYIGELIYEPTFLCRCQVTQHIGRSYVFALNSTISVDAFSCGNHARFINHAPFNEANVAVTIMLVQGEQRIGVYAKKDISAGSELFMDYGPDYPIDSVGS